MIIYFLTQIAVNGRNKLHVSIVTQDLSYSGCRITMYERSLSGRNRPKKFSSKNPFIH